jgi:heme/copper-type cytochrome/quinol oxidase subunit 1
MIFFLVMPALFGGFGNYFVPIFQGSPEVVYPRGAGSAAVASRARPTLPLG